MSPVGSGKMKRRSAVVVATVMSLVCGLPLATFASVTLYLEGDGVPMGSLAVEPPQSAPLPNHDPARDDMPGLLIAKGGIGALETDPTKYQQWVGPADGLILDGAFGFTFWAAMKDFNIGNRGVVEAFLLDCDSLGEGCITIAQSRKDIIDWSGGWGSWGEHSIEFGDIVHTIPQGRSLSIKITVAGDSSDDMWFAYASAGFPSMIVPDTFADIVVDCAFDDWFDGDGGELNIADEGGLDDWSSPTKLDVTLFGVSGNQVDTLHLLMAIDDIAPLGSSLGSLIDTNLDGNANKALVATINGAAAVVELYSCDDSLSDGCGAPVLEWTYDPASYCMGTAAGPWNLDTMVEIAVPLSDIQAGCGEVILGSMISYAAASLLTSPKDSIFGASGEDYDSGIHYHAETGQSSLVGAVGSEFHVRRSTDPSAVRSSSPVATAAGAPFEDLPGTLSDGETYFYLVERDGGLPVEISVHANLAEDTVRLGFDDVDAFSAPVDADLSSVTVSAPSVPADGSSHAFVTIIPRDAGGVPLGGGCDIAVDPSQLSPGVQVGPVQDNYDGSYTFEVTATDPGTAQVAVEVEGIFLTSTPQIVFY